MNADPKFSADQCSAMSSCMLRTALDARSEGAKIRAWANFADDVLSAQLRYLGASRHVRTDTGGAHRSFMDQSISQPDCRCASGPSFTRIRFEVGWKSTVKMQWNGFGRSQFDSLVLGL